MRITLVILFAIVAVTLSACRIPVTLHPLSDATSSTIDERLIGTWEVDLDPLNEMLGIQRKDETVTYDVQRDPKKPNTLIMRCLHKEAEDKRFPLLTTHFAMRDYLSIGEIAGSGSKPFAVCLYEVTDADHVNIYAMHGTFIHEQINAGKIAGQIDRASDGQVQSISITESSEKLRELVARSGDKLFEMRHPVPCTRVKALVVED